MSRRGRQDGPSGLVVVDKEAGWTSHDVVAKLRGLLRQRRTGHAGTLDPSATGVLLVGVGRATRLMRFLQEGTKAYEGELVLGVTTTTLDADGEVTGRFDMAGIGLAEARIAATRLTGDILQVPPMVSAIKVGGRRLHELAREGVEVERSARPVRVDRFELFATEDAARLRFEVACGSGTYVRSLIDDLGRALGGGAHMASLRRTRVGAFGLSGARTLGQIAELTDPDEPWASPALLSPAAAMAGLPSLRVDAEGAAMVRTGRRLVDVEVVRALGPVAVLDDDGDLLAVYERREDGLHASVVLAGG